MTRLTLAAVITTVLTLATPSLLTADTSLSVELDGVVFFEAEAGGFAGDWSEATTLQNFSGDGYLEWTGPNLFNSANAGRDAISYSFDIVNPGNYEFRWRSQIAKGHSNTESNDAWVRFPTGANIGGEEALFGWTKVYMGHSGAWFWDAKVVDHVGANVRQYFSAGTHTVEISGRSNGHAIDKMVLYKYQELELSPHDLDTRSGTPQSSINANQDAIDSGLPASGVSLITNGLAYAPGECSDGVLALAPTADVDVTNGQVNNRPALPLGISAGGSTGAAPIHALMQFDLSSVAGATQAALELSMDNGNGQSVFEVALLAEQNWSETDTTMSEVPDKTLQLAAPEQTWALGKRYSIVLSDASLPSTVINLGLYSLGPDTGFSIASREHSLQMPLLVLKGDENFCQNYSAALAAGGIVETDGEDGDSTTNGDGNATGDGSGDGNADGSGDENPDTTGEGDANSDNDGGTDSTNTNGEEGDSASNGNTDANGDGSNEETNDENSDNVDSSEDASSGGSGATGAPMLFLFLMSLVYRRIRQQF